jgi:tetratricopeptide (TPR) repeat protein
MPDPVSARPAICLNMIVRNEAHIVQEVLDAVAPYITFWVIVDTGSDDGTQDVIRGHMAGLGIPGELQERPWRNFGHNRSEALSLAQGHGDYIWVMDADDTVVGMPDFSGLSADAYEMRFRNDALTYWRPQLFRDGMPWRYEGVLHEHAECDAPHSRERLAGDYYIEDRRLGARNLDPHKLERDRDLLLAEVEQHPDDARSVFYLAWYYFGLNDFVNARKWAAHRAGMGGSDEEIYASMCCLLAPSMLRLGVPWPQVEAVYLQAWKIRPTRAEPLFAIAQMYTALQQYQFGYAYAKRAAEIPFPEQDVVLVQADIYVWRAVHLQAQCAAGLGKREEAFALCQRLLARSDIPDDDRKRIAETRAVAALGVAGGRPR